ncbi:MAG: hypothetical protein CMN76_11520 [Spirochaetaceae bacterium]|nr:hypothetical protein [Spirochaetaceae bacterium]
MNVFRRLVLERFDITFACLFGVTVACLGLLVFSRSPLLLMAVPLVALVLVELLLRVFLSVIGGRHYMYRIRPYFLVDDARTGYRFRRNINSERIEFLLFEKYAFAPGTSPSDELNTNKKQRIQFSTNSIGLRGAPIREQAPRLRVLCSGGSTTAGQGVHDNETWPRQLQQTMERDGYDVEVVNAGVYGFDSSQELENLRGLLPHLKPDLLILHQGWNEEFNFSSLDLGRRFKPGEIRNYYEKYFYFSNRSRGFPGWMLSLALLRRHFGRLRILGKRMSFTAIDRWSVLQSREYILAWLQNIREIEKLCRAHGVELWMVRYPGLVSFGDSAEDLKAYIDGSRLTYWHAMYQAIARERVNQFLDLLLPSVPVIDGTLPFTARGEARLALFSDEIHLTPLGESLLGACVADALINRLQASERGDTKDSVNSSSGDRERIPIGIESQAGRNSQELAALIARLRAQLKAQDSEGSDEIPTDMYTTY